MIKANSNKIVENLKTEKNNRLFYIDTLRVTACFLVILTHSNMGGQPEEGLWVGLISFLGSPSSELFLSLSGTVLLPVKNSLRAFYKKRFLKLLPPLFIWSVIIVIVYWVLGKHTIGEALEKIIFLPLKPVIGVYWFIYVMIGLYLIAPFLSPWLKNASKKSLELFILLWCINLLMPYLSLFTNYNYNQAGSHYWQLNYFGGFIGYWLLGYYLRKYPIQFNQARWYFILIGSFLYVGILIILKMKEKNILEYLDNLQIGSAFLVALLYTLAQKLPIQNIKLRNLITNIAQCSFGIYLIHIIVVRDIVWKFFTPEMLNPFILSFIIAFVSLTISYGIIKCISWIPGSKYLVGV